MLKLGDYNTLRIKKRTDYGLYLDGGDEGNILLPNRYVTPDMHIGDNLEVFIYLDQDERTIATTEHPIAKVGEFAYLECAWTNEYGAFLKWGLMKDLFCPFREQKKRMEIGKTYYVYIMEDEKTHRLMATAKVERYQKNDGRQRVLDFAEVLLRYLYEHDGSMSVSRFQRKTIKKPSAICIADGLSLSPKRVFSSSVNIISSFFLRVLSRME